MFYVSDCRDIWKDFVVVLVCLSSHLSWISNVRFLDNCDTAVVSQQRTKNVEPTFLLTHFSILTTVRRRIRLHENTSEEAQPRSKADVSVRSHTHFKTRVGKVCMRGVGEDAH